MRRRKAMADAKSLYRMRMSAVGPGGVEEIWYEGPFDRPDHLQRVVKIWEKHYALAEECRDWSLATRLEVAHPDWQPV